MNLKKKVKPVLAIIGVVIILYINAYVMYRNGHTERWENDGNTYVIYPISQQWVYYFFRPAAYLDQQMTGMKSHYGPHGLSFQF